MGSDGPNLDLRGARPRPGRFLLLCECHVGEARGTRGPEPLTQRAWNAGTGPRAHAEDSGWRSGALSCLGFFWRRVTLLPKQKKYSFMLKI